MDQFYVSWMKPIRRARIHRGACSNCNEGQGQLGQDKSGSGATGWLGPMSLEEAEAEAERFKQKGFTDVSFCGTCLRSHRPKESAERQ